LEVNFTMIVGQLTESVEVSAGAEPLNATISLFSSRSRRHSGLLFAGRLEPFRHHQARGQQFRCTSEWNSILIEGIDDA
jgi:hypothetical protein